MENESNVLTLTAVSEQPNGGPETETKPKREFAQPRANQSREMAERLVQLRTNITNVQADEELAAVLAARGMDAVQLARGLELQAAAATAYDLRQQAMGAQQAATGAFEMANSQAETEYAEYRTMARLALKAPAARVALGLNGDIPQDTEQFMSHARASYTAALENAEYLDALSVYNYSVERVRGLLTQIEMLYAPLAAANQAKSEALRATQVRNEAFAAMDDWYVRFKTIARFAMRGRPDLKARLGL